MPFTVAKASHRQYFSKYGRNQSNWTPPFSYKKQPINIPGVVRPPRENLPPATCEGTSPPRYYEGRGGYYDPYIHTHIFDPTEYIDPSTHALRAKRKRTFLSTGEVMDDTTQLIPHERINGEENGRLSPAYITALANKVFNILSKTPHTVCICAITIDQGPIEEGDPPRAGPRYAKHLCAFVVWRSTLLLIDVNDTAPWVPSPSSKKPTPFGYAEIPLGRQIYEKLARRGIVLTDSVDGLPVNIWRTHHDLCAQIAQHPAVEADPSGGCSQFIEILIRQVNSVDFSSI